MALDAIRRNRTPEIVAIYESGHIVVALVLGFRPGDVTILNDRNGGAGLTKCGEVLRSGRIRPERHTIHARAMVMMVPKPNVSYSIGPTIMVIAPTEPTSMR